MNIDLAVNNLPLYSKGKNIIRKNQAQKDSYAHLTTTKKYPQVQSNALQAYVLPKVNQGYKKVEVFDVPNIGKASVYELSNGHRVIILPKKGATEIRTFVKTDYLEDTTTSHFLEHLITKDESNFKGSTFEKELSKTGAALNAETKHNGIEYSISYPFDDKKDIETLIQIQAQMLQNPQFNQEKFEHEKGILISEYVRNDNNEQKIESENKALKKRVVNALFETNLSSSVIFDKSGKIKNKSLIDIQTFYDKYYQNQNMQTVIVGDVNPDETIKIFAKYFNKTNKEAKVQDTQYIPTSQSKTRRLDFKFDYNKKNIAQINFPAFDCDSNKDFAIMELLSELAKIRQCDFKINFINAQDKGIRPFVITIEGDYENNDGSANLVQLQKDFIDFLNSEITQEEFEIIKKRRKSIALLFAEENELLAQYLQTQNPSKDCPVQEAKYLSEISIDDIKNFISNYFKFDKALYVSASDNPKISKQLSFKGSKDTFKLQGNEYIYPNNLQLAVNSDNENKSAAYCLSFETDNLKEIKPATVDVLSYLLQLALRDNCTGEIPLKPYLDLTPNSIYISGESNPEDVLKLINLINNAIQYRDYSDEYFNCVKNILKDSMEDDNFRAKLMNINFGDNPLAFQLDKIAKKEDKIKAIDDVTLADIYELLDRITKNSQAKASLALPQAQFENNKNEIFAAVNNGFNRQFESKKEIDLEKSLKIKPNTSPVSKVLLDVKDDNNAQVCLGFKIAGCKDEKETIASDMLSIVLNNRIFDNIREKLGISYYLGATYEDENGSTYINLQCEFKADKTNPDDLEKVIKELQKEVENICTKPISKEELESIKLEYKKIWLKNSFTTSGKAGLLNAYSIQENNQKYQIIDSITETDLLQSAKTYLRAKPNIVIQANKDVINSNIGYITSLGQLV